MRLALVFVLVAGCSHEPPPAKPTTDSKFELLPQVDFVADTDQISPDALKTLDAVAATLDGNPSILVVEVRAYVSGSGEPERQELADRRAHRLVDYLVGKGIKADRLSAHGVVAPTSTQPMFEIVKRQ
jgi:OOP family OmpA-OmpF porin